ncbi:MAG: uncharacterized protein KVP18_000497 [Porospora cf. gigantea A]|uniref:uncharacterized protein n=1 Tax=Porospora cf. gigantea A TaxID=2853593 RepID=UPI003559E504|nr:MAG: hypothetical protein KVP18_000497 [Porospora cf. gigantea A]
MSVKPSKVETKPKTALPKAHAFKVAGLKSLTAKPVDGKRPSVVTAKPVDGKRPSVVTKKASTEPAAQQLPAPKTKVVSEPLPTETSAKPSLFAPMEEDKPTMTPNAPITGDAKDIMDTIKANLIGYYSQLHSNSHMPIDRRIASLRAAVPAEPFSFVAGADDETVGGMLEEVKQAFRENDQRIQKVAARASALLDDPTKRTFLYDHAASGKRQPSLHRSRHSLATEEHVRRMYSDLHLRVGENDKRLLALQQRLSLLRLRSQDPRVGL